MNFEEKASAAKEATLELVAFIKSNTGSYDELMLEPVNKFLSSTAEFKDSIEKCTIWPNSSSD